MPLYRRIARRGFSNSLFKQEYQAISLDDLSLKYEDGDLVSDASLREKGLLKGKNEQAKVLANGELTKKLVFEGLKLSEAAKEKVLAAGGEIR